MTSSTYTVNPMPGEGETHHIIMNLTGDNLRRALDVFELVGGLKSGTFPRKTGSHRVPQWRGIDTHLLTESITLVYPGCDLPLWRNDSTFSGPAVAEVIARQLAEPRSGHNFIVDATEGLFERITGTLCGFFNTRVPSACS